VIRRVLGALALTFALAHVPFLATSLEDIDSVNFALATRDFDVAEHRPHPPGYPIYVALSKAAVAVNPFGADRAQTEARSMAWLSLLAALCAIPLLYGVLSCLRMPDEDRLTPPWRAIDARAIAATALTVACPLFWYLAARPMSDMVGLAAALAAQLALLLAWWRQQAAGDGERRLTAEALEASGRMIVLGALLAGLALGFRSQTGALTLPLLAGVLADRIGRGVAGALIGSAVAFAVGVILWGIPLIVASGGAGPYLAALGSQAGEDFAGGEMLYSNWDPRLAASALMRTFIYPWESVLLGGIVSALALIGGVALLIRNRRAFAAVVLTSVPYLVFHLLFQDTSYTRYALPLVIPCAFLAVCGLDLMLPRATLALTGGLALWAVGLASPILASYGSEPSPTARAVEALRQAAVESPPGALAMHQTFRRPLEADGPNLTPQLPSPPRREWLELVRYWNTGNTAPLWFLADPSRSDLALIDPVSRRERSDFAWRFVSMSQMGGMRPSAVAWYRLGAPGWFAEEGWALTPETAGIARLMTRGPDRGPITARVRRRSEAVKMLIGGRHLGQAGDPPASFLVSIDGQPVASWTATSGFFLHVFDIPAGRLAGSAGLAQLNVVSRGESGNSPPTAIEQFDLQSSGSMMWGYDEGWHEAEYNQQLGLWRWTSDRATLRIVDAAAPVSLRLHIESPTVYFDRPSRARVWAGKALIGERTISAATIWVLDVPLAALHGSDGRVTIETDQIFVPAERGGAPDRRRLGLRIFAVDVQPTQISH
jgi:hypothetical protein